MEEVFTEITVLESEEELRKYLNETLAKELEIFFAELKDKVACVAFIHTTSGVILATSPKFDALFQYPRGRLLGEKVETLIPERFRHKHATEHRAGYAKTLYGRPMGEGTFIGLDSMDNEFKVSIELYSEEKPFLMIGKKLPITVVTVNRIG